MFFRETNFMRQLNKLMKKVIVALSMIMLCAGTTVYAQTTAPANPEDLGQKQCKSANLLGPKLITDICWRCIFPMKMAGAKIQPWGHNEDTGPVPEDAGESDDPIKDIIDEYDKEHETLFDKAGNWMSDLRDWVDQQLSTVFGDGEEVPDGASGKAVCMCMDNNGMPRPGIVTSFWEPYRLIEFQRSPGCLAALNGVRIKINPMNLGTAGTSPTKDPDRIQFFHYHYYSFPVLHLLELFSGKGCNPGGYGDFDLMYISEVDPTWNDTELGFFANPEAALFANPAAIVACIPDAVSSAINKPLDALFWCAGTWGVIYPLTGLINERYRTLKGTSLAAVRVVTQLHRRGFAWATMGDDALCDGYIAPYLPKNQYKFTLAYPVADTQRSHKIGTLQEGWGAGKLIPGVAEDPIYMLWRWIDCCNRF